jgi:hypothetical protein
VLRVLIVFVVLFGLGVSWSVVRLVRRARLARLVKRAENDFVCDRLRLQEDFRAAASVSGKPRGLIWKSCEFQNNLVSALDRVTGEIVGLVGVTISFEAVAGGGMEDVEAVGNLRAATAILTYTRGVWTTQGRAVFNLEPGDVLERYAESLSPLLVPSLAV